MRLFKLLLICGAFCSPLLSAAQAQNTSSAKAENPAPPAAKPAPVDIRAFFGISRARAVYSARISPEGRYLALLTRDNEGSDLLEIRDLQNGTVRRIGQEFALMMSNLKWINEQRLALTMRQRLVDGSANAFLFMLDADGGNQSKKIVLGLIKSDSFRGFNSFWRVDTGNENDGALVLGRQLLVSRVESMARNFLIKVDPFTAEESYLEHGVRVADQWVLDQHQELRIVRDNDGLESRIHYKAPGAKEWKVIWRGPYGTEQDIYPLALENDQHMYVLSGKSGYERLYRFDLTQGKLLEPALFEIPNYDFDGSLRFMQGKLAGATFNADEINTIWFDAGLRQLQSEVDALLPQGRKILYPAHKGNKKAVVLQSRPHAPGHWWLYDNGKLEDLGSSRPEIDPARMASKELRHFKARDGLNIPVYLTRPPHSQGQRLPAVLLVHGGPHVRGASMSWDTESQFLASRGYLVVEPQFRGSSGFGVQHLRAGYRQWGQAMQDDLNDTVQWMTQQGYADGKRICIAGASYGGYATLMGLIRDPQLYRCGIAWASVTDLQLLFDPIWGDMSDKALRFIAPEMLGHPEKDAAMLAAHSPINLVDKLRKPLLLAHGENDWRVPIRHSQKLYRALKAQDAPVEWVSYPKQGHGWTSMQVELDFWSRVENFLKTHLAESKLDATDKPPVAATPAKTE
ncbi:alpha/beta fold hydrolase [Massilia sp. W12]|uniref:alpha/beta hydrolase family protein n=1 Tax=Massilia sp. W12 TaxID=3126507 RepID=UPI0030CE21FF